MSSPSIAPRVSESAASSPGVQVRSLAPSKPIKRIVTSKTWVLPPRPKPGRKPSSDVPSTKRKAQNRAAQRAFRERRANRVTELEQQLMELERDNSVKQGILANQVKTLQQENGGLKEMVAQMKASIAELTDQIRVLSRAPKGHQSQIQQPPLKRRRTSSQSQNHSPPLLGSEIAEAASTMINFKNSARASVSDDKCSLCTREECLCEDVGLKSSPTPISTLAEFKPMAAVPLRKSGETPSTSGEIDFTSKFRSLRKMPVFEKTAVREKTSSPPLSIFSAPTPTKTSGSPASSLTDANYEESVLSPEEKCGFCEDGTPCMCREAAKQKHDNEVHRTLLDPPTTERLSQMNKEAAVCTGNPGTCSQCRHDPLSTLFCTTIAANSKLQTHPVPQKDMKILPVPSATRRGSTALPSLVELELSHPGKHYVPCADAYRTLSRHQNFRHTGMDSILNNLTTNGMFVEVESIVKCLHRLDRQFGSD